MSFKVSRTTGRRLTTSDLLLFTTISLDMSPSKLFLRITNFEIDKMSELNENFQLSGLERQMSCSRQNFANENAWEDLEDYDADDSEPGDVVIQGGDVGMVTVGGTLDPLQETHNMLMAWESMVAGGGSDEMMEGVERVVDGDLGDVDLSDLLKLEEAQPDDIALFDTAYTGGALELSASYMWGGPAGLGISMNSQLPLPFPPLAKPPSPPPALPIPGLDEYSLSNSSQLGATSDFTLDDDLPPSAEANMSSSDFFDQYEEAGQEESHFLEFDFIKTEVYITNAEWWLKDIKPYQKYRAKNPSRLRTSWTVIEGKGGAAEGFPADELEDW